MGNGTAAALEPTYTGYVSSTHDALLLFEACLTGVLHHVPRRPHDRERSQLVRSGSVFIYEENASGIKRWTDGVTWSPSRILGNFLVYRELDKPFPPGEKKRAMKKTNRRPTQTARPGEPYPRPQETNGTTGYSPSTSPTGPFDRHSDVERALVGSLVDSYGFKESGLVKKTMSVTVSGVTHHLVSYYSVNDVIRGGLTTPAMNEQLRSVRPRPELTMKQSFRAPIDDYENAGMEEGDPSQALYGYRPTPIVGQYAVPNPGAYYPMPGPAYGQHPTQPGPHLSAYAVAPPSGMPGHHQSAPYMSNPAAPVGHHSAAYPTGFESMSQNPAQHAMPTALPTLPNSSPTIYRNPPLQPRNGAPDASTSIDPTPSTNQLHAQQQQHQQPPASYRQHTFTMPSAAAAATMNERQAAFDQRPLGQHTGNLRM
ncbi:hypothetical protein AJ80_08713 [Polytolypa hystricis UAMH7299]|uniref:Gti1/Pac2 family protein n=1 Tax=Polytolypa hystricis (strain UAMH7299) TaxID=1447883 RepID=A0A2B7X3J1_POLH7|nr:hypothetical protein AJ80_08713 [Polytolypa hystricis UAMH7299]